MKLVTKISIGTAVLLFFFSQIFSLWSLQQSKQTILKSVKEYEAKNVEKETLRFAEEVRNGQPELGEALYLTYYKNAFRNCFSEGTAFYLDESMVDNRTSYEFDVSALQRQMKEDGYIKEMYADAYQFEEKIQDNYLLVSVRTMEMKEGRGWFIHCKDISSERQRLRQLFWKGFAAALILTMCILFPLRWMVKKILAPFYRLKEAANVIAGGDYEKRVTVQKKDEIGQVSESFNQMAESIQAHVEELSLTSLRQQQLLGSLAHELKTPMMAIQGYAESLRRISMTKAQQEKSLRYIESECKRLSRLSAKMLELTGLYQADGALEEEEISVKELFALAENMAGRRMEKKQIRLLMQVEPESLTCRGDRDMLMSYLLNLIDNACKASVPEGEILLKADEKGLYVRDFGCGIEEEEVNRVTEAFYMVDKARTRKEGGAGLGLAICQQIAEAHGGRIKIHSKPGEGTEIALLWK